MGKISLAVLTAIILFANTASAEMVVKCLDGDTIRLDNGTTVRLLGVDTPETVHPRKPIEFYGPEASQYCKDEIAGKSVLLVYDPKNKKDKYGRTLAYVYREEDGNLFNQMIILNGYGRAYTKFPFIFKEEFLRSEEHARNKKVGLWSKE